MARMCPPDAPDDNPSTAENILFARFKEGLPDTWTVLHSLGLAGHPRKPWAEIDFVLIGPLGIYCIEVKGGRVERRDGYWHFTNRHGQTNSKRQGPFEQVGGARATLFNYLRERLSFIRSVPVGYGVATPDIRFKVAGPDIEPLVVYDQGDASSPIADYLTRLSSYWTDRLHAINGRQIHRPTTAEIAEVVQMLRPDFDLRPSMQMRLGKISRELLSLTEAQYQVLDGLSTNPRAIVLGGAGTGKTFLAVEEAIRAASKGQRVLLCCFNRALGQQLRAMTADYPLVDATSLHAFMARLIQVAALEDQLPKVQTADLFTVFQPLLSVEALAMAGPAAQYDVLIVDEGQDLMTDGYLSVLDKATSGGFNDGEWRVFYDPVQNIFEGIGAAQMKRLLDTRPARYQLQVNCRNTAPIAVATALLSGAPMSATKVVDGPEVAIEWYEDEAEQRRRASSAIGKLRAERVPATDIVVLSPRRLEASCLQGGLVGSSLSLDTGEPQSSSNAIRYRTIQGFKGLESDCVVLVDLKSLDDDAATSLYVGASRAKSHLTVCLPVSVHDQYLARAQEFGLGLVSRG